MKRYRRASEVGEFAYCHRAWWLHHVEGHEPANAAARASGTEAHVVHGRWVRVALALRRAALVVGLIGLILLVGVAAGWF